MNRRNVLLGGVGLALGAGTAVSARQEGQEPPVAPDARISAARFSSAARKIRLDYPHLADYIESLCVIPAGEFQMGGTKHDNEKPVHRVYLQSFGLGATPVTKGLVKEFALAVLNDESKGPIPEDLKFKAGSGANDSHPSVQLLWKGCRELGRWASDVSGIALDLPSEAQWEYACRGGTPGQEYPWGGATDDASVRSFLTAKIWCSDNKLGDSGGTGSVNRTSRIWRDHPWGLIDMIGNVWEYCVDYYDPEWYRRPQATGKDVVNRTSAPVQPILKTDGTTVHVPTRCARGGSWLGIDPDNFRCAHRHFGAENLSYTGIGFRLCALPG